MATDPFDDLLEIENDYYKEGYDAGVSDSTYAGLIEGKVFGIEKGFEKALELGQHHGRALIWERRLTQGNASRAPDQNASPSPGISSPSGVGDASVRDLLGTTLPNLPPNSRLRRHVESLLAVSSPGSLAKDNSDEAVTDFDDRIAKASAKAKVISNIVGEAVNPTSTGASGIEESIGLDARH